MIENDGAGAAAALDGRKLALLEAVLGRDRLVSSIGKFMHDLRSELGVITDAAAKPAKKAASAHKLIGSAGVLGLQELAEACAQLELAVAQQEELDNYVGSAAAAAGRARLALEAKGRMR